MKIVKLFLAVLSLAAVVAILQAGAHAQGCGLKVRTEFFDGCGNTSNETSTCDDIGGNPSEFCFQGHGECCGIGFDTANVAPDQSCSMNCAALSKSRAQFIESPCAISRLHDKTPLYRPAMAKVVIGCGAGAQVKSAPFSAPALAPERGLKIKSNIKTALAAPALLDKFKCDSAGNVYLRPYDREMAGNHKMFQIPLQKILPDGSLGPKFSVAEAQSGLSGQDFLVTDAGELFQVAWNRQGGLFVVRFAANGSVVSMIPIEMDDFSPYQLAVFKSGEFLLSGTAGPRQMTPVTAVFSSSGKLIKRLSEPEDDEACRKAEAGDSSYRFQTTNSGNPFVQRGDAAAGSDGNVYLMRSTSPALVYAISPKGEVLRKVRIDPVEAGALPMRIRESNGKLAVEFGYYEQSGFDHSLRVVDLEGNPVAAYQGLSKSMSMAGYSSASGFIFVQRSDEESGVHIVHIAEP